MNNLYESMDRIGLEYVNIGAGIHDYDPDTGKIVLSVKFSLDKYLVAMKLGRKMRALHMFLRNNRKIAKLVKENIKPIKSPNLNYGWEYRMKDRFEYLYDDIEVYARSKKHAEYIKQQLNELLDAIQDEINEAGNSVKIQEEDSSND